MYEIDSPGSEAGKFVDENPALNKPGTLLPAAWLNMWQAEGMAFLTALGVTPDKTQNDQIFKCVLKMVAGTDLIARFTTTGNIALTGLGLQGGGDWGVALSAGNMILVKNQAVPQENGWYLAAGGTWPRVDYLDSSAEITPGKLTKVTEGATLADSLWMLTTDAPIVLNSSALTFERKDQVLSKASSAEVLAGTDNLKYLTAASLLAGLLGAGGLQPNDYITLPFRDRVTGVRRNLIIQLGILTPPTGSSTMVCDVTYPIAYPNAALIHLATIGTLSTDLDSVANYRSNTQSLQVGIPSLNGCEMQAYGLNNVSDQRRIQYISVGW